jgi:predicted aspartyl protease
MRACPHVEVKFGDVAVKAVIDTGSQASTIVEETYQFPAAGGIKMAVLPVTSTVLISAFGMKISRIRIQAMTFTIRGSTFENIFLVTHQLRNQCILGWDFLYHYKFSINAERGVLSQTNLNAGVEGIEYPFVNEEEMEMEHDTLLQGSNETDGDIRIRSVGLNGGMVLRVYVEDGPADVDPKCKEPPTEGRKPSV